MLLLLLSLYLCSCADDMTTNYSDDEFSEWLAAKDGPHPVVLVVAEHSTGTVYFSDVGYTSWSTDTLADTFFDGIITERIVIENRIDISTVGVIGILNDGVYNDWLAYKWRGYPLQIYLGDARWRFSNYRKIADLINGGISAKGNSKYEFNLTDSGFSLDELIGSEAEPLSWGSPVNVTASLIDSGTLRYKLHSQPYAIETVYDNGLTVAHTSFGQFGEFTLSGAPAGMVTADVVDGYGTAVAVITNLLTFMGSTEGAQLFDIADAILPDPDNTNSSVAVAANNAVITFPVVDGDYVLNVESNSTPTSGAKADIDLASLVTGGIDEPTTCRLTGQVRHVGSGAPWSLRTVRAAGGWDQPIIKLTNTDTSWVDFEYGFVYKTSGSWGTPDTLRLIEFDFAVDYDGGLELRNVQLYKTPIQLNPDNLLTYNIAAGNADFIGIFTNTPTPVRDILSLILQSHGGYYRVTPLGVFELFQLDVPATSSLTLTVDDIKENGITHVRTEPPVKIMTLKYRKNWTVQGDGLAGAVTTASRAWFAKEWSEVTAENTLSDYPIAENRVFESYIGNETDAQIEVNRRQAIRSVKREVFTFNTYLAASQVSVGDTITINYPAYGFESGKDMVVIGIKRKLGSRKTTLMVWG